jgi:outer membrane protein assembly factor BamA
MLLAAAASFPQAQTTQKKAPPKPAAKTVQPVQDKWPIGTLKVGGNSDYTAEQVPAIAGIKVGNLVGRRDFETARDRLMATGVFDLVGDGFEPDGTK